MNFLPIVFTCDNNYYKYTNVVITSILHHINKNTQYEFNILSEFISEENKEITFKQVKKYKNVKVKFIELKDFDATKFYTNSYFNTSTYFRLYIPELFKNYDKILYLDGDLIVSHDLTSMINIDFENKLALGCLSNFIVDRIKSNDDPKYPLAYFTDKLKMPRPEEYFNAGVMVYNLDKIRNEDVDKKVFVALEEISQPKLLDQDLLNSVFNRNGGIKLINQKYNNTRRFKITHKRLIFNAFLKLIGLNNNINNQLFYIYHFAGKDKPWNHENVDTKLFYYYACKSPFIKDIVETNNKKLNFLEKYIYRNF